jgi:hypothetical protein
MRLMRRHRETLRGWRNDGLLPLTQLDEPARYIYYYARSDLERILAAPRRGKLGINRVALKAAIDAESPELAHGGRPVTEPRITRARR